MKSWRKVEVAQTLLSAIIILIILSFAFYNALPSVFRPTSPEAVKLVLSVPSSNTITINRPEIVTVYAANTEGQMDRTRNDIVELTLDPPDSGVQLSATRVTLVNGEAKFTVMSSKSELVALTATWIDGRTPLKPAVVSLNFLARAVVKFSV